MTNSQKFFSDSSSFFGKDGITDEFLNKYGELPILTRAGLEDSHQESEEQESVLAAHTDESPYETGESGMFIPNTAILAAHEPGWRQQVMPAKDGSGDMLVLLWPYTTHGFTGQPFYIVEIKKGVPLEKAMLYQQCFSWAAPITLRKDIYVRVKELLTGEQMHCDVPQHNYRPFSQNSEWYEKYYHGSDDE